jgi:hypothetical protein
MIDAETGRVMDPSHPAMTIVNAIWESSTPDEQEAFWRVTVKNSREPDDVKKVLSITRRIQEGLREMKSTGFQYDRERDDKEFG